MNPRLKPLDLTRIKTVSMRKRDCRLHVDMLAKIPDPAESLQDFYRALPRLGRAAELIAAAEALTQAALAEKGLLWFIDARVIEAGLSPLIVRLVQRGLIRAMAMTGAAAVRDFEIAVNGMTLEDVRKGLKDGMLGMARETGEGMNSIINEGVKRGFGLGECLGRGILDRQPRYYTKSIMAACSARLVPCTVHVAIGSDGFHCHPTANGTMLGKGSLKDIQILGSRIEELNDGGALVSIHRKPSLQEVFYHAYAANRNLGGQCSNFALIRFGEDAPDFSAIEEISSTFTLPGPIELIFPLFTGVLFSLVE